MLDYKAVTRQVLTAAKCQLGWALHCFSQYSQHLIIIDVSLPYSLTWMFQDEQQKGTVHLRDPTPSA